MKSYHRILSLGLASILAVSSTAILTSNSSVKNVNIASAADDTNDDWLHAKGSRLYDKDGKEVWLTGANWFGMNCTENFPHGLWSADVDVLLSSVADHGINIIRFPVSTELLLSWMNGDPYMTVGLNPKNTEAYKFNPDFCHEDGSEMNSMEVFDVIIQKCKKYGIKALVDVHSPASHNSGHNYNLWYYEPTAADCDGMATIAEAAGDKGAQVTWDDWIESLTWLAQKYANDDTIVAYDLKNEPHGKRGYNGDTCPPDMARWDDTEFKNNWKYSAEMCANSILKVNPNALILIEGIEQSPITEKGYTFDTPDVFQPKAGEERWYGAWWGGNLRGVREYPVTPTSGTSQIVYSPHDYGPSVYAQTWFDKDFTTQTLLDDYWYDTWAYIVEEDIAPLLIGEWGGHMDGGKNQKWMELLRDYMIDNHINHTFWCLNPNSGDTGGLLDATFSTWDNKKYALFEESLWQTSSSGKYIGLDHQIPLGQNGISLSEFYSSYANSEGSNLDGGTKGSTSGDTKPPQSVTTASTTTTTTTTTPTPIVSSNIVTTPVSYEMTAVIKDLSDQSVTLEDQSNGTTIIFQFAEDCEGLSELMEHPVGTQVKLSIQAIEYSNAGSSKYKTELTKVEVNLVLGTEGTKIHPGDADLSGEVDISDVILVSRIAAEDTSVSLTAQGALNADVDGKTGISAADAAKILKFIAKLITKEELASSK
ncbi:MAG: cellulase family glycosylhydrolase [Oscillospiraceae bacterium]|nr:cellulase family glycosylhydrolase [Oscillospiraceae bacterium]